MPVNPITGAPLPYSQGGGAPMVGPQQPQAAPGRMPMWAGGGANPGFGQAPGGPQGAPPPGMPGAPTGPPGMPLGLTPELLAMIQARMASKQFRPGPEDSLIPTGQGGGLADLRSGDY